MKKSEVQKISRGVYRVHWKGGGVSVATVGIAPDGDQRLPPTNWANVAMGKPSAWGDVERVELIAV